MICYTSHLTIKNGIIRNDISKGIVLHSEPGDIRPNLSFNNLKIFPSLKLLYTHNINKDNIYTAEFSEHENYIINDISLVTTKQHDIIFHESNVKDKDNMLFYLIIINQDNSDIQPIKVDKNDCRLIYQSINKDADNAKIKKYLYKFINNSSMLEININKSKQNNIGYLWKDNLIWTGSVFNLNKMLKEENDIDKYL
jgi:DNA-binding transcriptional regulator WhiA